MANRPDKQKIIDEVWDEDRVRSFLHATPPDDRVAADHFTLLRAYQSMRAGDFERFLRHFTAAGGDLDAGDEHGRTVAERIAGHRHARPFVEALVARGARTPTESDPATES